MNADIIGSQEFNFSVSPNTGSLNQAFSILSLESASTQSGDFVGLPVGTDWGNFSIDAFGSLVGDLITIADAGFGTFSGNVFGDSG